jgi:AcrR family transcriptional regulator
MGMKEIKKGKILTAARSVFLRYGYKRVSMNEIAEAAGVSRPALYILFRNKEDIFVGVFMQWVDETLLAVKNEMAKVEAPEQKLTRAFELWSVHPFEMMMESPEARELIDGSFEFAQDALRQGYQMFETTITPAVASLAERRPLKRHLSPEEIAHLLASATRGFKQTAVKAAELRLLIEKLLMLSFSLDKDAFRRHGKVRRST